MKSQMTFRNYLPLEIVESILTDSFPLATVTAIERVIFPNDEQLPEAIQICYGENRYYVNYVTDCFILKIMNATTGNLIQERYYNVPSYLSVYGAIAAIAVDIQKKRDSQEG